MALNMTLELHSLAWASLLGLAHILIAGNARTKELGIEQPREAEGIAKALEQKASRVQSQDRDYSR